MTSPVHIAVEVLNRYTSHCEALPSGHTVACGLVVLPVLNRYASHYEECTRYC